MAVLITKSELLELLSIHVLKNEGRPNGFSRVVRLSRDGIDNTVMLEALVELSMVCGITTNW